MQNQENQEKQKELINKIYNGLKQNFKATEQTIERILCVLLSGGHLLFNDKQGTGKTTLAKVISKLIDLEFKRIQFTSDLTPSDVTGINIFNPENREWEFHKGPIFSNIVLADEINRAPYKTQSALLEAMPEKQVTIDGVTHKLSDNFFILATQNPSGYLGTYELPEAQIDRFSMVLNLGYLSQEDEIDILLGDYNADNIESVISSKEFSLLKEMVKNVHVHKDIVEYIVKIVQKTRNDKNIETGASVRGSQMLLNCAKALSLIRNNETVYPDDIKELSYYVLSHRFSLSDEAINKNLSKKDVIDNILASISVLDKKNEDVVLDKEAKENKNTLLSKFNFKKS